MTRMIGKGFNSILPYKIYVKMGYKNNFALSCREDAPGLAKTWMRIANLYSPGLSPNI